MRRNVGTQTLTITVIDDDEVLEEQESIVLAASISGDRGTTFANQSVTIENDDELTINVNNDGNLNFADGLILYYALRETGLLGTGVVGSGRTEFHRTFIGPYLANSTEPRMLLLLAKIHADAALGSSSALDVNGDDSVTQVDEIQLYYATRFAQLLSAGTASDGFPNIRGRVLGLSPPPSATPEDIVNLLRDINVLITAYE